MRKLFRILLTVAALLSVSPSYAQEASGVFSGPYASLGIGYQNNKIFDKNVQAVSGSPSFDQASASEKDVFGQVLAGYGHNLGEKFNVSVNLFYNFGHDEVDDIKATYYQDTAKQTIKNSAGIYIAPGYYINPQTLIFLKAGYVHADQEYIRKDQNIHLNHSIEGYLWGVGAKYLVSDNIFIGADITKLSYGKSSEPTQLNGLAVNVTSKVEQTNALISIGYQF